MSELPMNDVVSDVLYVLWCELTLVLCSHAGMQLNNQLLQQVGLRFADENYDIDFDDYLTCIVRLENMFSTSQKEKKRNYEFTASTAEVINYSWTWYDKNIEVYLLLKKFLPLCSDSNTFLEPGVFQALDGSKRGRVRMNMMQVKPHSCNTASFNLCKYFSSVCFTTPAIPAWWIHSGYQLVFVLDSLLNVTVTHRESKFTLRWLIFKLFFLLVSYVVDERLRWSKPTPPEEQSNSGQ